MKIFFYSAVWKWQDIYYLFIIKFIQGSQVEQILLPYLDEPASYGLIDHLVQFSHLNGPLQGFTQCINILSSKFVVSLCCIDNKIWSKQVLSIRLELQFHLIMMMVMDDVSFFQIDCTQRICRQHPCHYCVWDTAEPIRDNHKSGSRSPARHPITSGRKSRKEGE